MSQVYSVICSCIILKRIHLKISQQSYMSKLEFFLSHSHIRDFQAKLGGSQQDRGGWTVCSLPVLLTFLELASPINVCLFLLPFFSI